MVPLASPSIHGMLMVLMRPFPFLTMLFPFLTMLFLSFLLKEQVVVAKISKTVEIIRLLMKLALVLLI